MEKKNRISTAYWLLCAVAAVLFGVLSLRTNIWADEAYTFAMVRHSFADIFWPTACALCCGLMGVPINKWYKFITPLFGILFVMEFVFITAAVFIGY